MHVVVLYNEISAAPTIDEQDVLVQCAAVQEALGQLGHRTTPLACGLNLQQVRDRLLQLRPDAVFNLVEAFVGTDRLMPLATLLLESLGLPFSGTDSLGILSTSGKLSAKRRLLRAGLPTPAWFTADQAAWQGTVQRPERAILKAVWEHASFGMDDEAVVDCRRLTEQQLAAQLQQREANARTAHFAEQYIAGREFNLTVLAGPQGPEVLPPAEIQFIDFPPDKPRIVGYSAKWQTASAEYQNTPRTFEFPESDRQLLRQLQQLALRCWQEFDMAGCARVDFRVDADQQPWILEINANPCLSPDAGAAAAVQRAGLDYCEAIQRILTDSFRVR